MDMSQPSRWVRNHQVIYHQALMHHYQACKPVHN